MNENLKYKISIDDRDIKMLELLTQGGSSKMVAKNLGYKEGTMRVYLHNLYRKIGVKTKTSAVSWYLERMNRAGGGGAHTEAAPLAPSLNESFGDMALRTSLLAALGAMGTFVGAYGRLWEVATRLKGNAIDEKAEHQRRTSRQIWGSLLAGDFAYAKRMHEQELTPKLFIESPSDCMLVACMLFIGGYTHAADRVTAHMVRREKGRVGVSASEHKLVRALRDALYSKGDASLVFLHHLAAEKTAQQPFKHAVMVALFYVYQQRRDGARARAVANAIWAEAEGVRQHLQAMGEKPLLADATLPDPPALPSATLRTYVEKLERV
jgi:DNA-binding CsgD family transcriptional regulator